MAYKQMYMNTWGQLVKAIHSLEERKERKRMSEFINKHDDRNTK